MKKHKEDIRFRNAIRKTLRSFGVENFTLNGVEYSMVYESEEVCR